MIIKLMKEKEKLFIIYVTFGLKIRLEFLYHVLNSNRKRKRERERRRENPSPLAIISYFHSFLLNQYICIIKHIHKRIDSQRNLYYGRFNKTIARLLCVFATNSMGRKSSLNICITRYT